MLTTQPPPLPLPPLPQKRPEECATMDELRARHKKELKALEGEKRNHLKKTKATAGKGRKGKEALAA